MDNTNYGIVLVTTGSQQEAEKIANALVEAKLAPPGKFHLYQLDLYLARESQ